MEYDYDLAFALANGSLCIFAGAGVSKHLTGGSMPDWPGLLDEVATGLGNAEAVKAQLDQARASEFPLEDCAQILELAFFREALDFRRTIAEAIDRRRANPTASATFRTFLEAHPGVDIITTNYDLVVESLLSGRCNSNYPGKPLSRRDNCVDVFHVHGCVMNPSAMIVTTNDYYRFINDGGYFSQKVSTMLHENTTVVAGYSLSDPNLKAILNGYRASGGRAINRGNLFYTTRGVIPPHIRDYYETAYGIAVIQNTDIDALLSGIEARFQEAKQLAETTEVNLQNVLRAGYSWTDQYLKLRDSLFHIVATANTNGHDVHSTAFATMLAAILSRKVEFTKAYGAWEQYNHLAEWVIYLGSIMDMPETPLQESFVIAARHSLRTMSKNYSLGSSWAAFGTWSAKWASLTFRNRMLLRHLVDSEGIGTDAIEIVSRSGA